MERDLIIPWPKTPLVAGASTAGDNVIYDSDAKPDGDDPLGSKGLLGWYRAAQASTFKLQVWAGGTTWITVNNNGSGDSVTANTWFEIKANRPAGRHRLVINFATLPATYDHPTSLRGTPLRLS